jgi:hypothetical protein
MPMIFLTYLCFPGIPEAPDLQEVQLHPEVHQSLVGLMAH